MAVIVAGLKIKGKMSGIGNYKCRRQKLVIDAGHSGNGAALELERAVSYGMLLNELVSNACKHAFLPLETGVISVGVQDDGAIIELIVADTGQGLPEGFDYQHTSSIGLTLVDALVRQLRGTIEIHSPPGTTVRVQFPAKAEGD